MQKHFFSTASVIALLVAGPALANDSLVDQIGAGNIANVDQTMGEEGDSDIDQIGNGNLAEVTQDEDPNGSASFSTPTNVATILQNGDNSRARIEQFNPGGGTGVTNTASIDQDSSNLETVPSGYALNGRIIQSGEGNASTIKQRGNAPAPLEGSGLTARNDQSGDFNTSTIEQRDDDANPHSDVDVTQTGNSNTSTVLQRGPNEDIDVVQNGDNNTSDVEQGGKRDLTTMVTQNGNDKIGRAHV